MYVWVYKIDLFERTDAIYILEQMGPTDIMYADYFYPKDICI